jgi:hypothetical protein
MKEIFTLYNGFQWKHIPFDKLTKENLKEKCSTGETLIHKLALDNKLNLLPKGFLSEELLLEKDQKADNAYIYLARQQKLDTLPKELITKKGLLSENKRGETPLERIIEFNKLETIDLNFIKEGILLEKFRGLGTYLHFAAMNGELKKIPKNLWEDKLGLKDSRKCTVLHWAAEGKPEDFPICKESLKLINSQNIDGETPLHKAQLKSLPPEYLTKENLSVQDKYGDTPLHKSAWTNSTTYLPIKQLDENLITIKNKRGQNLLHMIALGYQKQRDEQNLKEIIKILSRETLMGVKGLNVKQEALNVIVKELNKRAILSKIKGNELSIDP